MGLCGNLAKTSPRLCYKLLCVVIRKENFQCDVENQRFKPNDLEKFNQDFQLKLDFRIPFCSQLNSVFKPLKDNLQGKLGILTL